MHVYKCYFKDDFEILIANPIRLIEIINDADNSISQVMLSRVTMLIIDEYIQFRKMQTMDYVEDVVEILRVTSTLNLN